MKRSVILILLVVLIVCGAAACSATTQSNEVSTTSVTDAEGQTRYYEYVTGENGEQVTAQGGGAVLAQIETQADGIAVTERGGEYVTTGETTVLAPQNTQTAAPESQGGTDVSAQETNADNEVPFVSTENSTGTSPSQTTTSTTSPSTAENTTVTTTQSATDAEGWINKWY